MSFIGSYNPHLLDGVQHVHFIGCGGSGTYPLIQILHSRGLTISGSDVEETKITKAERAMGVTVYLEHDAAHLGDAQLVVYSAAIHDENPELKAARARGIPAVERSVMLGYVSRMYSHSVCVSGTHGKTTTTGMITTMLELAGKDPAAVIGGKLPLIGGYGKAGHGDDVVIEACEYSETFLHLTPFIGVILNIDNDHLEYYGTMGRLKMAFQKFALLSRTVVFNMDDRNTVDVVNSIDRPVLSFGINEEARFRAVNIQEYRPGFYEFDVLELGEQFAHIKLGVPGYHNIYKCAVLPLSKKLGEKAMEIRNELSKYFMVDYDDTGSIGKRYRREDEIGTPFCITVDFDTVGDEAKGIAADNCVTVRDRDTMEQVRMPISELKSYIESKIEF